MSFWLKRRLLVRWNCLAVGWGSCAYELNVCGSPCINGNFLRCLLMVCREVRFIPSCFVHSASFLGPEYHAPRSTHIPATKVIRAA
ncbi:hypothetical protein J3F83DRAFT_753098 [Trichoderma novae-zelandiae]